MTSAADDRRDDGPIEALARVWNEGTTVIVCHSRCLYCGRQTPHEVCHEHSEALHPGWWEQLEAFTRSGQDAIDAIWGIGRDKEPETCEDGACPVWEPGEWDHKQKWAAMTPEQRRAETDEINRGIAERRAARRLDTAATAPDGGEGER